MHFRKILQECLQTAGTMDSHKSGTANQNKKIIIIIKKKKKAKSLNMTQELKYMKLNKISDGQYQNVKILVHSYRQ